MRSSLIVADYRALEVVILADLCVRLFHDDQLARMIEPGKPDIHCVNARMVFGRYLGWNVPAGMEYEGWRVDEIPFAEFAAHPFGARLRTLIKTVWYGLQYGKGSYGFATLVGPDGEWIGEDLARRMLDGIEAFLPGPFNWQSWVRAHVLQQRGIYSLGGRWCPLHDETEEGAPEWLRNRAYRRAYNFPMQATGAEIVGDAMVRVSNCPELRRLGYALCLQVHDELVMRGPLEHVERASTLLAGHMTSATANGTKLLVPLQVSVGHGDSYYDAK